MTAICDHYTRVRRGGSVLPTGSPVIGLLFGTLTDDVSNIPDSNKETTNANFRMVEEVIDATEAIYAVETDIPVLDLEENTKKMELWSGVFENHCCIGWYSVGSTIQNWHIDTHQAIQNIVNIFNNKKRANSQTEDANATSDISLPLLFLLMNCNETPIVSNQEQELPLFFFQLTSINHQMIFMKVENNYQLVSAPYETVCIDTIMKSNTESSTSNYINGHNQTMLTSLNILNKKIDSIIELLEYFQDSKLKSIPKSSSEYQDFIRKVSLLTMHLPNVPDNNSNQHNGVATQDTEDLDIDDDALEAMLTSYIGYISKMKSEMSQVNYMYKQAFE